MKKFVVMYKLKDFSEYRVAASYATKAEAADHIKFQVEDMNSTADWRIESI